MHGAGGGAHQIDGGGGGGGDGGGREGGRHAGEVGGEPGEEGGDVGAAGGVDGAFVGADAPVVGDQGEEPFRLIISRVSDCPLHENAIQRGLYIRRSSARHWRTSNHPLDRAGEP